MAFFLTLALFALSFIATVLLQPKPRTENAKAGELGDFGFPITAEGTPTKLLWGRLRLRDPNVLWYGDFFAQPIREKVKTGLFSSRSVTVGHRYFIGLHLGLAIANLTGTTRILNIWSEDDILVDADVLPDDNGAVIVINQPSIYGGSQNGGGFRGSCRVYPGTFTQGKNAYLEGRVPDGTLLPNYRGLIHAVFEFVEVGEQPTLRPLSFEVQNIPMPLGLGEVGNDGDANPAEVIYDILTSDWGKLALGTSVIDSTSFIAAGNVLDSEGNGISLSVSQANDARDVLEEILTQIDGVIFEDPTTRTIRLRLIRNDYSIASLPLFNPSNVIEVVNYSVSTWQETSNQIRIIYNSRENTYNDKTAFAQDMANVNFQGGIRSAEFQYPGVTNGILANEIAARELNLLSIPLTKMRIITNRDGALLRPGDVIRVNWPDYGIEQIIMRVQKFDLGGLEDGQIAIDLIQDRFAVSNTVFAPPPDTLFQPPVTTASPVTVQRVIEMPRWIGLQGVIADQINDAESSRMMYFAGQPGSAEVDFDVEVSLDAGVNFSTDAEDVLFVETARVSVEYPLSTPEYDTTTGLILQNLSDTSILGSATRSQIENSGANLLLIGDEILAYENFTNNGDGTFTLNNVWRGVLDTSPRTHAALSQVFFVGESGLEILGTTAFDGNETVRARYITDTVFRRLDPTLATPIDLALTSRAIKPYPPDLLTIDGIANPSQVFAPELPLTWARRDRQNAIIVRPNVADETPQDDTMDTVPTGYIARHRLDGGVFTETDLGNATTSGNVNFGGFGNVDLEIYAERNDDSQQRSIFPVLRSFSIVDPTPTNALFYDTYPAMTPAGAWGLRRMISTYAGALIRIRDTNDNTEQDVGFTAEGDLSSFIVVGEPRVVTVYDQTGNNNPIGQSTLAAQPLLDVDGSVGGLPKIIFNGTNEFLESAQFLGNSGNALLIPSAITLYSGEHAGDDGYLGAVFATIFGEYGIGDDGTFLELFANESRNTATYNNPGNPNNALALIGRVSQSGRALWQEESNNAIIDLTTPTTIGYGDTTNYRVRVGRDHDVNYNAGSLYELSFHDGEIPSVPRTAALETALKDYWRAIISALTGIREIIDPIQSDFTFTIAEAGTLTVKIWGGGGAGGANSFGVFGGGGGYTIVNVPVVVNDVIRLEIATGSAGSENVSVLRSQLTPGWPNGGDPGAARVDGANSNPAGGAGSSNLYLNGQLVAVAGGGGGAAGFLSDAGAGGGPDGQAGQNGGAGGTQSAGGAGQGQGETGGSPIIVATVPILPGDGGDGAPFADSANDGGGGGGGYYGGGGADGDTNPGGGGSGFVNTALGASGVTTAGDRQTPGGSTDEDYVTGTAIGTESAASTPAGADGGGGIAVVGGVRINQDLLWNKVTVNLPLVGTVAGPIPEANVGQFRANFPTTNNVELTTDQAGPFGEAATHRTVDFGEDLTITLDEASQIDFSDGTDFTIEFHAFLQKNFITSAGAFLVAGAGSSGSSTNLRDETWKVCFDNDILQFITTATGVSPYIEYSATSTLSSTGVTQNTWHHYAIVKRGNVLRFFINGNKLGNDIDVTGLSLNSPERGLIGINHGPYLSSQFGLYDGDGRIAHLRITKAARYTSNFSVPTTVHPTIESVFIGDLTSAPFINRGQAAGELGVLGGAANVNATVTGPYSEATSLELTGAAGDVLRYDHNDLYRLSNSDFTIECYVRLDVLTVTTDSRFMAHWDESTNNRQFLVGLENRNLRFSWSTLGTDTVSHDFGDVDTLMTVNTWHHVCVVRRGNNLYGYVDGIQLGATFSFNVTLFNATAELTLGDIQDATAPLDGRIAHSRVSRIARFPGQSTGGNRTFFLPRQRFLDAPSEPQNGRFSTVWKSGTVAENNVPATVGADISWTNVNTIVTYNVSRSAQLSGGSNNTVPFIRISGFGFSVPTDATILGVEVQMGLSSHGTTFDNITWNEVRLAWDANAASVGSSNPANAVSTTEPADQLGGSRNIFVAGGPTDLWGSALTPAIVNQMDFSFIWKPGYGITSNRIIRISSISMRVFYTR